MRLFSLQKVAKQGKDVAGNDNACIKKMCVSYICCYIKNTFSPYTLFIGHTIQTMFEADTSDTL